MSNYKVLFSGKGVPVKAWVNGVAFDEGAQIQLEKAAQMPFIHRWISVMPDVHKGLGATIGSVIPTVDAVIPAAVGVDLGCGMMAVRTSLKASDLPDNLEKIRSAIESAVPHGRSSGDRNDRGAWSNPPDGVRERWGSLDAGFQAICEKHPKIKKSNHLNHLGTLGTGNHFIEMCLDEEQGVWFMLHSGSRGVGNRIGTYFISLAKEEMRRWFINLPDQDLAYLSEGTEYFDDYVEAVEWAQTFARVNRELMMEAVLSAVSAVRKIPAFEARQEAVNCHHNYISREHHFGKDVWVTRKGAVRARKGEMGIIPGSMGAKSFIVRGLGNEDSFHSCSHGAGRTMSRTAAKKKISLEQHVKATQGVACRKDHSVIDESPAAYKPIDAVMAAQKDLVEIVHTLKQVVCVKG